MCDKYKLVTCVPERYQASEIQEKTGLGKWMVKKAMTLRAEKGVFSTPDQLIGKHLSERLIKLVKEYYLDGMHSRPSPRFNDTIRGPNNTRLAKHHMLFNQKDLFALFKEDHPTEKIGRTSFLKLCPRECVWPGQKPYENVCLCVIHQNFKQQYEAIRGEKELRDLMADVMCSPVRMECAFGLCNDCPKWEFIEELFAGMEQEELIQHQQWSRQDTTKLETILKPVDEFTDQFERSLIEYAEHDFINKKQKSYHHYLITEGLKNKPILLVQVDFAQNLTMSVQDSVYGFHWSKDQATLHPFSVTWWDPITDSLMEKHYVVISDTRTHNANTFNSFKRKVMARIQQDFKDFNPQHIIYISDGCGGQYKNKKNMANLMEHAADFGFTAEWMFSASYHGKGPCDRIAAIVKKTTRIHSLKPGVTILDAHQMFEFCMDKLRSEKLEFLYVSDEEMKAEECLFEKRYSLYKKTIPGTRMFHHFTPENTERIALQKYSGAPDRHLFDFKKDTTPFVDPNDLTVNHFYCFVEANEMQIGMLVDANEQEVGFQCMKMNKTNLRCRWPKVNVYRRVSKSEVLLEITAPQHCPGGYYLLGQDEKNAMKERLKLYKRRPNQ